MKNFFLGFLTALILAGLVFGIYYFQKEESVEKTPSSQDETKKAEDTGTLKVTILYQGKSVKGLEVDLSVHPGAEDYPKALTQEDGVALFENIPEGDYKVYFNNTNFPSEYSEPYAVVPVKVEKDKVAEKTIELADY